MLQLSRCSLGARKRDHTTSWGASRQQGRLAKQICRQESPWVGRESTQILPLPTGRALSQHACPTNNHYIYISLSISPRIGLSTLAWCFPLTLLGCGIFSYNAVLFRGFIQPAALMRPERLWNRALSANTCVCVCVCVFASNCDSASDTLYHFIYKVIAYGWACMLSFMRTKCILVKDM